MAYSLILLIIFPIILIVFQRNIERKKGWKTYGIGRDEMRYEEFENGKWVGITYYAELHWKSRLVSLPNKEKFSKLNWEEERINFAILRIKNYCVDKKWEFENDVRG